MRPKLRLSAVVSVVCVILLIGCRCNKPIHLSDPAPVISQAPPVDWDNPASKSDFRPDLHQPSVAVIEFDERGRLWRCGGDNARPYCELNRTIDFIQQARRKRGNKQLVVVTYVHGWHHNAGDTYNFWNFQKMINCLNWGNPKNDNISELKAYEPVICTGMKPSKSYFYVGVYVGWRGESMNPHLGWLTSLSVLNRHNAAAHLAENETADGFELTVLQLSKAAKEGDDPARFILIGHSFGGLIVNRTTTNIYEKRLSMPMATEQDICADMALPFTPFADLVVVVNPADSALHVADLISRFKERAAPCPTRNSEINLQRPMLVSLHTSSDSATDLAGSLGLKVAFQVDRPYMKQIASNWDNRPDQHNFLDDPPTVRNLRGNTINRVPYLRNLCYLDQPNRQDEVCLGMNDVIYAAKEIAYHDALKTEPDPVPFNTKYSRDPFFHGAYELLTSVCMNEWEVEMANSQWSKEHEFQPDFKSPYECEKNPKRNEQRQQLHDALMRMLRPYLAFPNETGELHDDLLLDIYRRYDTGTLSCGDVTKYDSDGKAIIHRACSENLSVDRYPGNYPWNNTPVWTINTSYEILQAHSGFWNTDAISIITGIAAQFPVVPYSVYYQDLPEQVPNPTFRSTWPMKRGEFPRKRKWKWPWSNDTQQQQQQQR